MQENQIVLTQRLESLLIPEERKAYEKYLSENKPGLSVKTSSEFFELFLNGSTCAEICRLNPSFGLGIIVKARIDHSWDDRKEQYITELFGRAKDRYQKSQLEAIEFASDSMAVYHKMWGDKFKRFIQTGNLDELGEFRTMSFKNYKDFTDLLLKLTGQEGNSKQQVSGEVIHKVENTTAPVIGQLTSKQASEILKAIDADFKKE